MELQNESAKYLQKVLELEEELKQFSNLPQQLEAANSKVGSVAHSLTNQCTHPH